MSRQPIADQIWDMKYRFKTNAGEPIDINIQDTWMRIAVALASVEKDEIKEEIQASFYDALEDFKYIPAGRIVAGAGTGRLVTLFNCYVMGTVPDSISGIYSHLREAALTMQQGGGIGYDFSSIRPKGSEVKGVAADASGPLSFMDCWNSMCKTIMSAGSRRGAMMATLRCDHPDIEAFIEAKADPTRLRMFNMSVLVTDDFMAAVKADTDWRLHFEDRHGNTLLEKTVRAVDLWNKIMQSTYDQAEPGVIFIDRINATNNLNYCETISSTNPCGEQPLPPYGACLLGSMNLTRFILNPFTKDAAFDYDSFDKYVRIAIRMMDNVVDVSNFPLPEQEAEAKAKRRLGLGITGLADALLMMWMTYGEDDAVRFTEKISKKLFEAAYDASCDLAEEKGSFPMFDAEKFLAPGTAASKLPKAIQDRIRKTGIRNSHTTSIAPTGTISLYAGNVSSGIEPVFAYEYTRKVLQKDGTKTEELVQDYAVDAFWEFMGEHGSQHPGDLPDHFVSAQTLAPLAHVRMQAAAQKWVDSSISKTINCPEDISFEDFVEVYMLAYESGCKGCTTYRPNDVTGSVLSVEPKKEEPVNRVGFKRILVNGEYKYIPFHDEGPTERPEYLNGTTYKLKYGSDSIYVTITDIIENGKTRPFEIFINSKNIEHFAWTIGMARMISAIFRRPHDSRFVVEELKSVFDPKGGAWMGGRYIPSILAAIGGVIEKHMRSIGYIEQEVLVPAPVDVPVVVESGHHHAGPSCPKCNSFNVKKESGCFVCKDCGESTCG
jgi:ribonucleoside-diphosphate reductase alpha chain